MQSPQPVSLVDFAAKASEAATLLRALSNEQRLLILCHLMSAGELSVSALSQELNLSQSALSQHIARLREDGIVVNRREAQSLYYSVADEKTYRVLSVLRDLYCPELTHKGINHDPG